LNASILPGYGFSSIGGGASSSFFDAAVSASSFFIACANLGVKLSKSIGPGGSGFFA